MNIADEQHKERCLVFVFIVVTHSLHLPQKKYLRFSVWLSLSYFFLSVSNLCGLFYCKILHNVVQCFPHWGFCLLPSLLAPPIDFPSVLYS